MKYKISKPAKDHRTWTCGLNIVDGKSVTTDNAERAQCCADFGYTVEEVKPRKKKKDDGDK